MKTMENKSLTIKEIARQLRVSVSTVSRALADHPRISDITKQRVRELASESGYEPNRQAIFFKQQRTRIIGIVLPSIREEFFSQAICGIEEAALQHNYTILFGQSYDDVQKEREVVEIMKKQRVDGLIISLAKNTHTFDHLTSFDRHKIPVVYFDRVPELPRVNKVYCDLISGTADIISWLYKQGRRRIALINGPEKMPASADRLKGYMNGISKQKLKIDMQLVVNSDFSKEKTASVMDELFRLKSPPDAIISFNDYIHMDVIQHARQKKIRINTDIFFASYANLPITGYTSYPPKISLEQYPVRQGELAMKIMTDILERMNNGDETFVSEPMEERIKPTIISHQADESNQEQISV